MGKGVSKNETYSDLASFLPHTLRVCFPMSVSARDREIFSSLVRRETGKTLRSLLTEQRMKKAESQLLFTGYSIEGIVESAGYRDAVSLYGNFKEFLGMTPNEIRCGNSKRDGAS